MLYKKSYSELLHLNICLIISKYFHASSRQISGIHASYLFLFLFNCKKENCQKKVLCTALIKGELWDWCPSGIFIWVLNVNLTVLESNNSAHFFLQILIYGPSWWRLQDIFFRERTPESPVLKFVFWDKVDTYINITTDKWLRNRPPWLRSLRCINRSNPYPLSIGYKIRAPINCSWKKTSHDVVVKNMYFILNISLTYLL